MRILRVWCLVLLLSLVSAFARAQATAAKCVAEHYKVVVVPLQPSRVNNSGQVAGSTEDRAAVWSRKDGLRELPLPSGFSSARASGLNEQGDVVGHATKGDSGEPRAFEYSHGKAVMLSASRSQAVAINNAGEIVGEENPSGPALWRKDRATHLGACCGGKALAINSHGQVVGQLSDHQGRYRAFLWDAKGGFQNIGSSEGYSSALAINDAGHILIQAFSAGVFLHESAKDTPLPLSPNSANRPMALSNCDVVVGAFGPSSDYNHAFAWDKKYGLRDLNTVVDSGSGWILRMATDINDAGEIVGTGQYMGKEDVGFLLTPGP